MSGRRHSEWSRHIDQIIRSGHYTWLAEGLGGEQLESALMNVTTDIIHICKRQGIDWDILVAESYAQFEREELELDSTAVFDEQRS